MPRARARLTALILIGACAGTPELRRAPRPLLAPSTELDPIPFTPAPDPARTAGGGRVTVLVASNGIAQARATVARFIRAVLDQDHAALADLLSDEVIRINGNQRVPSDELAEQCLLYARQLQLDPERSVEDSADLRHARMHPLGDDSAPPPAGLAPTDIMVEVSLRGARSPILNPNLTPIPCLTPVVVRPGPRPKIVAVGR